MECLHVVSPIAVCVLTPKLSAHYSRCPSLRRAGPAPTGRTPRGGGAWPQANASGRPAPNAFEAPPLASPSVATRSRVAQQQQQQAGNHHGAGPSGSSQAHNHGGGGGGGHNHHNHHNHHAQHGPPSREPEPLDVLMLPQLDVHELDSMLDFLDGLDTPRLG